MAGVLSYLLLIIYQPFGTSEFVHPHKNLLLFPYAIATTFSLCTINLLSRRNKENWTIGLELVKVLLVLLSTSVLSCFYNTFVINKISLAFGNFVSMFVFTAALGLPVSAIYLLGRYIYFRKRSEPAVINNEHHFAAAPVFDIKDDHTGLHIVADNGNFHLRMRQEDFVYAEAVDNYCFIHFYKEGIIHKEIIRIPLTRLLDQVQTHMIKRIHRSFVVNLEKVRKYKGNAAGYKLSLNDIDNELMISRSYVDSIIPVLKSFVIRP